MYETIRSPLNYGGLTLKNRIIFAPTSLGLPREELVERLKKIAAGGCAMIIIGDVPVLPHGLGPSLYTRKGFDFYKTLADAVHQEGCRLCAQLHQSDSNLRAMVKYIPGVLTKRISMEELRPLLNQQVGPYITGLPEKKIQEITEAFGTAAELALRAGFDMVQVHGDRMCGSFSAPPVSGKRHPYLTKRGHRLLREWSFAPLALPVFLRSVTYLPPNDIHHLLTGKSQRLISRVFQRLISCP